MNLFKQKRLTTALFGVYMVALIFIILFKFGFSFARVGSFRTINLIPFAEPLIVNNRISFQEMFMNSLIFVPFGIFLGTLKPDWSFIKKFLIMAGVSFAFEALQYAFAIGSADITDFIQNALGGAIGILVYMAIKRICGTEKRALTFVNICAFTGTFAVVALYIVIFVVNV